MVFRSDTSLVIHFSSFHFFSLNYTLRTMLTCATDLPNSSLEITNLIQNTTLWLSNCFILCFFVDSNK